MCNYPDLGHSGSVCKFSAMMWVTFLLTQSCIMIPPLECYDSLVTQCVIVKVT